jgi:Domain of unknown function (DUF4382)/Carboxypeptidase regulatory-like domain
MSFQLPRTLRGPAAAMTAVLCAAAVACGGGDQSPQTGALTVSLTDAPFPFDSVARADLFVVRIDAKVADTDSAEADAGKDDDDSGAKNHDPSKGWVTVATPRGLINLLDLQSGKTMNLGTVTLPAATYRGFRLILDTDRSSVTLKSGAVLTTSSSPGIKWPSAGRSGIKIKLDQPFTVGGAGSEMVVDFDLGHSFVMRGSTISKNGLLFKPVIRATARELTGSISGTVRGASATGQVVSHATVEVLKAGTALGDTASANVVSTTATDDAGAFKAAFLMPGSYSLRITPPAASTTMHATLVSSVTVTSGKDAPAGTVVLP